MKQGFVKQEIAIILPAYNEASVIGKVLDSLPKTLEYHGKPYETVIIVVDDGSTDMTDAQVSKRNHVRLIRHILNSGAGAATRTGLHYAREAGCDFAVIMDADGQHAASDVIKLAKAIIDDEADLIIGSRLVNTQGMPWYRVLGNKGLSFITFLVFGVFVGDSQSGLRAFNKKALERVSFRSNHYAHCSEMLWTAKQQKLRIKEVPIKAIYTEYSLAKGQSNWGAVHIIRHLVKRRIMEILNG